MALPRSTELPMGALVPRTSVNWTTMQALLTPVWARYAALNLNPPGRQTAAISEKLYDQLDKLNKDVNQRITYKMDGGEWGADEAKMVLGWSGTGDCEDYVLTKRYEAHRRLGIPLGALMVAVCFTAYNKGAHILLLLHTSSGDYVLDNFSDEIAPWDKVPYVIAFLAETTADFRFTAAWQSVDDAMIADGIGVAAKVATEILWKQYYCNGRRYRLKHLDDIVGLDSNGLIVRQKRSKRAGVFETFLLDCKCLIR